MATTTLQQISPQTIKRGEIPFNLYCKRRGKAVLFCRKGFEVTDTHLQSLENRQESFFIDSGEWQEYIGYARDSVRGIVEDESIEPRQRARTLHQVNKQLLHEMQQNPYHEAVKEQSEEAVDNYVRLIISAPTAATNLFDLASLDVYTYSHSLNVCTLSILMAQQLEPDNRERMIEYGIAGLMHDIGKVKVDQEIITKNGKLTDDEFKQIKLHPVYSDEIIRHHEFSDQVAIGGRSHHERIKGGGYPDNLAGDDIPTIARVLAVVDVYDALTSKRSYKSEIRNIDALRIMQQSEGAFDDQMFRTLLTVVASYNNRDMLH